MSAMDTSAEQGAKSVMGEGRSTGVVVHLHPLAVINISDHHTRIRVQTQAQDPLIVGLLYGHQSGRETEILNSCELVAEHTDGEIVINREFMTQKMDQFKEVFKTLEWVGWYATHTGAPTLQHLNVHRQLYKENESLLFLKLDTRPDPQATELPVSIYESILDDKQHVTLCESEYQLATEEAERIGVSLIAHHSTSGASKASAASSAAAPAQAAEPSQLTTHISEQANAVTMLSMRLATIRKYLAAVQKGELPADHNILRAASRLCSRLPVSDFATLDATLAKDRNDVMLTAYLASITKTCNAISDAMDKFATLHDKSQKKQRFV